MSGGLPEGLSNLDDLWADSDPNPASGIGGDTGGESAEEPAAEVAGAEEAEDTRLYLPGWESGWRVRLKTTWDREYCFAENPGEEFYHLLMAGEVYVEYDEEQFCLACARRRGVISDDRLHWKRSGV